MLELNDDLINDSINDAAPSVKVYGISVRPPLVLCSCPPWLPPSEPLPGSTSHSYGNVPLPGQKIAKQSSLAGPADIKGPLVCLKDNNIEGQDVQLGYQGTPQHARNDPANDAFHILFRP